MTESKNSIAPWSNEGRVLASALEAAGIPVTQVDYHIHFCYPHLEYGFCRYRIFVPVECQQLAKNIISEANQNTFEPIHACPKCKGPSRKVRRWGITVILYILFSVFWPFYKNSRRCGPCKWTWHSKPPEPWTKEELGYDPKSSGSNNSLKKDSKFSLTQLIRNLKNAGHKAREDE